MAAEKKTKGAKKGKGRPTYTEELKQEVLAFIQENPVRGVLKQAAAKFKISYPTVNNWIKGSGAKKPKAPRGAKAGKTASGIVTINGVKYAPVAKAAKPGKPSKGLLKSLNAIEKALASIRKSL